MKSKLLIQFLFGLFCSLFLLCGVNAQTDSSITSEMKSYHSPGFACFLSRQLYQPDLTTFVTAHPEMMTEGHIKHCVSLLRKQKWKLIKQPSISMIPVDALKEFRSSNMACTHVAMSQFPMLYQVVFTDFYLTGKGAELVDCMSSAAQAPNRVPKSTSL